MARICIDVRPAILARGTGIGNYTYQLMQYLAVLDEVHDTTCCGRMTGLSRCRCRRGFTFTP